MVHDDPHGHVVLLLGVHHRLAQGVHGELVHGHADGLAGGTQQHLQALLVQDAAVPGGTVGELVVPLKLALRAHVGEQRQFDGVPCPTTTRTKCLRVVGHSDDSASAIK